MVRPRWHWINHGLPMYVAIDRKPKDGAEIQNSADGDSGIMLRLKIEGFHAEFDPKKARLYEVLRRSTSLRTFRYQLDRSCQSSPFASMLEHDNTTLESVEFETINATSVCLSSLHYTVLNKWGRAKARDPSCSLSSFVQILCDVNCERNSVDPQVGKHSILYGLLLESPGLWSQSALADVSPTRKDSRKRTRAVALSR